MTNKTNKIIPIARPGMETILEILQEVGNLYNQNTLDMVALSPHNTFRRYITSVINDVPDQMRLAKVGHYNLLIRYLDKKRIPRECMNPKNCPEEVIRIGQIMEKRGDKNLVSIVNQDELGFFLKVFEEQGFDASTHYPHK